jgi:hypothetical protein
MKNVILHLTLLSVLLALHSPAAATWYIDNSVSSSGNGQSWSTAFKTIQEGIDAASNGDTVIVAEGTYVENIKFNGKNIVLTSTDPLDPTVVANTIIDGNQVPYMAVVSFAGTENGTCILFGFTIRNGTGTYGGGICGGTEEEHTLATIQYNAISNNTAASGGGICFCDGTIQYNKIIDNTAPVGGGVYLCDGTIQYNEIIGNGGTLGGGLCYSNGTIEDNFIAENTATAGGGLGDCNGTIRNNVIARNSAGPPGGGLYRCNGTIENNTVFDNSAVTAGGGLYDCSGTIRNCIIWGNAARLAPELGSSSGPTYSCIRNWQGGGAGNISAFPYFVDPVVGDYHLRSWSPCIDAGDPASSFSNEPQPNGGRIDMGAYGNTPEATSKSPDSDHDLLPDDWERHFFGNLSGTASDDPDGDGRLNSLEYSRGGNPAKLVTWYVDGSVASSGDGTSWQKALKTIQEGIDAASEWDKVLVAEGTYVENVLAKGKSIQLTSTNPLNAAVVANTIIDGNKSGSVVKFFGTEDESSLLSGFTIRNGYHEYEAGAGIRGGSVAARAHATIENNVITGNIADGGEGGGIADCEGIIRNNTIAGNSAQEGGGLYRCDGTIQNNSITENTASSYGGGLANCGVLLAAVIEGNTISDNTADHGAGLQECEGTIRDNVISNNSATGYGGGLRYCEGTIERNIITGNSAGLDGGGLIACDCPIEGNAISGNTAGQHGGGLRACDGLVQYNTISGNSANNEGGGLSFCTGTVQNNIIVANTASSGGGVSGCTGIIQNNLVAGNSAAGNGGGLDYTVNGLVRNCTIVGNSAGTYGGGLAWANSITNCIIWGNTGGQLANSQTPTYSCIEGWTGGGEANTNDDPKFADDDGPDDDPSTFEDNDYRLAQGSPCIDTGNNEDWMGTAVDLDGNTRVVRGETSLTVDMGAYEYRSFQFKISQVNKTAGKPRLTWNSRAGDTYTVWSCQDLAAGAWSQVQTVASQGSETTWSEPSAAGETKFYRVEMK